MKRLFVVVAVIFFSACFSHAGQHWIKTYGGNEADRVRSIQQTTDGGYIVAGDTESFGTGDFDLWIFKLDINGDVIWQKSYGDGGREEIHSIQQTIDGGYIVLGYTESFVADGANIWVLKLNINGDITWQKTYTYGIGYKNLGSSIQQTTDGGYVVSDSYGYDIRILKLDSSGNISWQKIYDGGRTDGTDSLQQTTDGGYIVVGQTYPSLNSSPDIWVLKLDINGNITWQKTYGGSYHDYANFIQQTSDGGYIVAGYFSFNSHHSEIWVLKLNDNGNIEWQKTYGGSRGSSAQSIQQTTDGGYIVAGTESFSLSRSDIWLLKLDINGEVTWQKTYGGSYSDYASSIQQTTNGGYIVAGDTKSFGAGDYDIWVLKLNNNGEIPDCEIMGTGNVTVADTSVASQGNSFTIESIPVSITSTNAIPLDTFAEPSVICSAQIDPDDDGVPYDIDNCPYVYNPDQEDTDTDGIGDVCDNFPNDYDNDGADDNLDNCFFTPNPAQINSDSDTFGDECDNCPTVHNPDQADYDGDNIGDACDDRPFLFEADGHYRHFYYEECTDSGGHTRIEPGIELRYYYYGGWGPSQFCPYGYVEDLDTVGIMEFSLSSIDGLLASGQMQAELALTVKDGDLPSDSCLSLYSIQDANENGIIEEVDVDTEDFIGEVCEDLQVGDIITFDVTTAVEHDLYDLDQTMFSGFVIDRSTHWEDYIEFYDHTDLDFAPRLNISKLVCPISLIYGTDSAQTQLLRSLRDNVLSKTPAGKALIELYYHWSPIIVKAMEQDGDFKEDVKEMVDGILPFMEGAME